MILMMKSWQKCFKLWISHGGFDFLGGNRRHSLITLHCYVSEFEDLLWHTLIGV